MHKSQIKDRQETVQYSTVTKKRLTFSSKCSNRRSGKALSLYAACHAGRTQLSPTCKTYSMPKCRLFEGHSHVHLETNTYKGHKEQF